MKKLLLLALLLWALIIPGCTPITDPIDKPDPDSKDKIEQIVKENLAKLKNLSIDIDYQSETDDEISTLTILTINDFHGALLDNSGSAGAARIGKYLIDKRNANPNGTIVLAAGDMFQGTGISNYRYGLDVIKWMNAVKFDAMTLGNHEFDWGLDEILKYRDSNLDNGEAGFPFLGANIKQLSKGEIPSKVEPYTIIERGGVKVGIIGYIGYGLEKDIAPSMVADYEFLSPVPVIDAIARHLRTSKAVDIIIALGHDSSNSNNQLLVNLTGDARIDAIVNGHMHLNRTENVNNIPIVQAGSSGSHVGEITFTIDKTTKKITNSFVKTVKMDQYHLENQAILSYVNQVKQAIAPLFERIIGYAGKDISRTLVTTWAVNELRKQKEVDIAFINSGGIRADAFPINNGDPITVSKAYQIMPFDNSVKLVKLTGSIIRTLAESDLFYSTNLQKAGSNITINGEPLNDQKLYLVATIDYVFDQSKYSFLSGDDIEATGELFRDIIIKGIEQLHEKELKWTP